MGKNPSNIKAVLEGFFSQERHHPWGVTFLLVLRFSGLSFADDDAAAAETLLLNRWVLINSTASRGAPTTLQQRRQMRPPSGTEAVAGLKEDCDDGMEGEDRADVRAGVGGPPWGSRACWDQRSAPITSLLSPI
jgi:hypothetical protein